MILAGIFFVLFSLKKWFPVKTDADNLNNIILSSH